MVGRQIGSRQRFLDPTRLRRVETEESMSEVKHNHISTKVREW